MTKTKYAILFLSLQEEELHDVQIPTRDLLRNLPPSLRAWATLDGTDDIV